MMFFVQLLLVSELLTLGAHEGIRPCDAKRKKMRSSGQLFRACWPSSAEHTVTSLASRTWFVGMSVCLAVCYHVHHAQEIGQRAIATDSVLHWLDLAIFIKLYCVLA